MTLWFMLYIAAFAVFSIAGIYVDFKEGRPLWFLTLAVASNLIIIVLIVSYGSQSWFAEFKVAIQILFVAAMVWECYQAILDFRATEIATNAQDESGRISKFLGILLFAIVSFPAFFIAGISAFRDQ